MAEKIEQIKKPSNVEKSLISNDVLSEFSVEEENLQGQEDDFLNMKIEQSRFKELLVQRTLC